MANPFGLVSSRDFEDRLSRQEMKIKSALRNERDRYELALDRMRKELLRRFVDLDTQYRDSRGPLEHLGNQLRDLEGRIRDVFSLVAEHADVRHELHSFLAAMSLGVDADELPLNRYVAIRLFLSNGEQAALRRVSDAVVAFSRSIELKIADDLPAETGSWYKRWFAKTERLTSRPEIAARLEKAERAIELAALQKNQADIDKKQSEAAALLLASLQHTDNAVCQIGSILIVKTTEEGSRAKVLTRTLTAEELIQLERNPQFLQEPRKVLGLLGGQDQLQLPK